MALLDMGRGSVRKMLRGLATATVAILTAKDSDPANAPTITSGTGVPTESANNGSLFLRTDGTDADDSLYVRAGGAWIAHKGQTA